MKEQVILIQSKPTGLIPSKFVEQDMPPDPTSTTTSYSYDSVKQFKGLILVSVTTGIVLLLYCF